MLDFSTILNQNAEKVAFVWKEKNFSYEDILTRIQFWQSKLNYIKTGQIIGVESDFSPETIAILITLITKKAIIVPLDINNMSKNSKKIEIAQLDYLIRVNDEYKIDIHKIEISNEKNEIYKNLIDSNIPGLVLFTSGSSGEPKGAVHNFDKLLNKFQLKRKSLLTINFLLFDHWGGLNTLFHVLSSGGSLVFLENAF